jgi:RNA polymerase sigma-70 factor (ECF subfamily)
VTLPLRDARAFDDHIFLVGPGAKKFALERPGAALVADDPALVARIRAGDRAMFERLFRAYYDPLCAFVAGYVGTVAVAEEIVQDVLFGVWQQREQWTVTDSVRSYLYGAARNRAINAGRRVRVAARCEIAARRAGDAPGMGQRPEPADARASATDFARALARALDHLPDRCRETFLLRRQHGLSIAEIAQTMSVTAKCVERQLTKAMRMLREELADFA